MPCGWDFDYFPKRGPKKGWRYPGVPIPYRLRDKYSDPTVKS